MVEETPDYESTLKILADAEQTKICELFPSKSEDEKRDMAKQIEMLNSTYPGGIKEYVQRAKELLLAAKEERNPYDDYKPSIPEGEIVNFATPEYVQLEEIGYSALKELGFVLVAGGLGERLGYNGIKISIGLHAFHPSLSFIAYYIKYILTYQEQIREQMRTEKHTETEIEEFYCPLCIMTSGDTHNLTLALLEEKNYFSANPQQITIVKQEKVPALIGINGEFAIENDRFEIITKPHGHGDVHTLLHMNGVIDKWQSMGKKWAVFFQDTNPLIFKALPHFLGVSIQRDFDMNSLTVVRKPGEAVGAICKLINQKIPGNLTINVEYNQLDPLLRSKWDPNGDVPGIDGYSKFPGNTNVLIFKLTTYNNALTQTKGLMPEFVNPKYTDPSKTIFKTPTRLECMMQDFPKLFPPTAKVGFSCLERWIAFTTVKNNLQDAGVKQKGGLAAECAASCESDVYYCNRRLLEECGVVFEGGVGGVGDGNVDMGVREFGGVVTGMGVMVVIMPEVAVTLRQLKEKIKGDVKIRYGSMVILEGKDTILENVVIEGAVRITKSVKGAVIGGNKVEFVETTEADPEFLRIRGYKSTVTSEDFLIV